MDNLKIPHLFFAPLTAVVTYFVATHNGLEHASAATAAITLVTAWWWATEAIPVPATSLIPFCAFPIFGVLTHKEAAQGLGSHIILLMLGGFIMAKALERSGAHRRFALGMLRLVSRNGAHSKRALILAFMLSGAFLSMWISNTATCLMLMPIVLATLNQIDDDSLTIPLILSVAFACSIGGIATLIGTPPNIIFAGVYEERFGQEFGFLSWLKIGLPMVCILLPTAWWWLSRNVRGHSTSQIEQPAPWSADEKRVIGVFAVIVFLWIFRTQPFGGWSTALELNSVSDSTVALFGALLMFMVPSSTRGGLIDWDSATQIPWGILLMFAAGITIAAAFFSSGLANTIGDVLGAGVEALPLYLVVLIICLSITFFTEINSNLATTTLVLPILAATAVSADIAPELLMIPATISASCAFMLPVATAPNAIAYATGRITVNDMLREGVRLNLLFALIISALSMVLLT